MNAFPEESSPNTSSPKDSLSKDSLSAGSGQGRPVRILLVEDNPADVRLTREMLRESKLGNDLLVAHTAEEAEEILGLGKKEAGTEATNAETRSDETSGVRPDLVLLDLDLPVKSGHDLLQQIKSHSRLKRIPVVILTSSEAEEDVVKSYDEHANAYVTKPVDLDEIATIVRAIDEFWFQVVRHPKSRHPKDRRSNDRSSEDRSPEGRSSED